MSHTSPPVPPAVAVETRQAGRGVLAQRMKIRHLRWYICGLVCLATIINYLDRQVFSILAPDLQRLIGWSELEYGRIVIAFQVAYAGMMLVSGRIIDRIGTKLSFGLAVVTWSLVEMGHALARSAFGFGVARFFLALTEAANFPAAAKAVSEWFGPSERAFATGIFISGVGAGAIIASLTVPPLAAAVGWQWTFVLTGALGFLWFVAWIAFYDKPQNHPWLTDEDRALVPQQVDAATAAKVPWVSLLGYRETWAYGLSKSLIDPIFWFLMFWLPKFLAESHGIRGVAVVPYLTAVYICADIGSLTAGYVSSALVKRGWNLNAARKITMLVLTALASPTIVTAGFMRDPVIAIVLIATACGVHQAWSAMVWTLPTDLFPSRATASVAGIGAAVASLVSIVTAEFTGRYLNLHPGYYAPIFVVAGLLYPLAFVVVHVFSPRLEQAPLPS
jgi:MFS transporter, ACS family, aldohexuronate transporter